ncbi:MAG: FAD-dependent monooxygenase [Armatimonadetes bacterium]|nr:FAD-dependent monooxygenase [Anaerolineae bacterium]
MTTPTHALVIGGSMAGLLAARVLSDHFDRVTIIDRDTLPQSADLRGGVPQARHLHTLLIKGQQIIEGLFPGFTESLCESGAVKFRWGLDTNFVTTGGTLKHYDSGIDGISFGRASLEWVVRQRVQSIRNINFVTGTVVEHLLTDASGSTVTGVQLAARRGDAREALVADLVVDASGRGSKAPEWLASIGYPTPTETVINAHTAYATRWYQAPAQPSFEGITYAIQPRPAQGLNRGGGLMMIEDNQWVITLTGAGGDLPPTDDAGFLEYARSLATPALYDAIKDAQPISPIYGYRRLENRMRHYEKLPRRPENFIITGDAAIAFNPIYGQGMTAAALDAEVLQALLGKHNVRQLNGFAGQFQARLFQAMQGPWLMATGEDLRYPSVEGAKPGIMTRMIHGYFDLVSVAMAHDTVVTHRFLEVMNLIKQPAALLYPDMVLRVLRHTVLRRVQHTPAQPAQEQTALA